MDVTAKVKEIIIRELNVNESQITDNANFIEDLNADSLDTVQLIMAFEDEFKIKIPDEDAEKMKTVGDAVSYLKAKLA